MEVLILTLLRDHSGPRFFKISPENTLCDLGFYFDNFRNQYRTGNNNEFSKRFV